MGKWSLGVGGLLLLVGGWGQMEAAIAHGVTMNFQNIAAIAVQATYDSGEPLADAQVTVYEPDSDTPWITGRTDASGKFIFTPNPQKTGMWQVKVRQAGHGGVLNVPVGAVEQSPIADQLTVLRTGSTGYTPTQKGLMVVSVIWGLIGTALFFTRRKR